MDAKTLNLTDAFRLASLISKHIDKIQPQQDAVEFISNIIDKLSPEEYLRCVMLLTQENEETIKKEISLDILRVFIEGLKLNQIVTLVQFWKSLGL